jgi:hypothetical protein
MAMRALKIVFGGAGEVALDWGAEVSGRDASLQRAAVLAMTHLGSDQILPDRGTEVASRLLSAGVFSFTQMQHVLNFGALKVRRDDRQYAGGERAPEDTIVSVQLTLLGVVAAAAAVSLTVKTADGELSDANIGLEGQP